MLTVRTLAIIYGELGVFKHSNELRGYGCYFAEDCFLEASGFWYPGWALFLHIGNTLIVIGQQDEP